MAGDWDPVTSHHCPLFTNPATSIGGRGPARWTFWSPLACSASGDRAGSALLYGKAGRGSYAEAMVCIVRQAGERKLLTNRELRANLEGKRWSVVPTISRRLYSLQRREAYFHFLRGRTVHWASKAARKERGLAGIMFWEYNGDSEERWMRSTGRCGHSRGLISERPNRLVSCWARRGRPRWEFN